MFFAQIEKLCKYNKTTPTAVTLELGYSKGSMSHWKKGNYPSGDIIIKFAEYFGVTTDYLLGLSEEKTNEVKNEKENKNMDFNFINYSRYNDEQINFFAYCTLARELPNSDDKSAFSGFYPDEMINNVYKLIKIEPDSKKWYEIIKENPTGEIASIIFPHWKTNPEAVNKFTLEPTKKEPVAADLTKADDYVTKSELIEILKVNNNQLLDSMGKMLNARKTDAESAEENIPDGKGDDYTV